MNKVNSYSSGKEFNVFNVVIEAELCRIIQDIKLHSCIAETRAYIEEYISTCDRITLPESSDSDINNKTDFDLFSGRIIEKLSFTLKNLPECTIRDLILPSDDYQVMDRLGCTHACPICSALCWGQRNHHLDDGESKKHHTCHQPMGLSGVAFSNTNNLSTEMCHKQKPKTVWFVKNQEMQWKDVIKLDKYKNWKFEKHINIQFNNLMKWFFLELNERIANKHEKHVATEEHIISLKIKSSDINKILAEINQKI
jgi:hypothetical protein